VNPGDPPRSDPPPAAGPRVLAVTSGKGGVGKTSLSVNLALGLRLFGRRVLLVDADLGLANVDVLLGLDPKRNLREVLLEGQPLDQVVADGPRGLKILPGASGVEALAALEAPALEAFLAKLHAYCRDMDFVVVDTSPGVSPAVVRLLLAADETVLVTNPERMALTDAYALLKVLTGHARRERPEEDGTPRVSVVMNRATGREEAVRAYDRLRAAAARFLSLPLAYLGPVGEDDAVGRAARRQVDFLTHYEAAPCSHDVRRIAARLVSPPDREPDRSGPDMARLFRRMIAVVNDE